MEKAALDAIVRILAEAFLANVGNRFKGIGILCPQNTALFDTAPFLFLLKPWRELFSFFCDLLPDLADDLADAGVKRICVQRCIHTADRQSVFAAGGQRCLQVDFAFYILEQVILVIFFIALYTVVNLRKIEIDQRISIRTTDILLRHGLDVQIIQSCPYRVDNVVFLLFTLGMVRKHTVEVILLPCAVIF